jgi:hypothetical protein
MTEIDHYNLELTQLVDSTSHDISNLEETKSRAIDYNEVSTEASI